MRYAAYCVTWRSPNMTAPAFYYFRRKCDALRKFGTGAQIRGVPPDQMTAALRKVLS